MKYLVRAVKYFIQINLLMAVILGLMMALKLVPTDIDSLFKDGYESLGKIALMFGVVSLLYPRLGYSTRLAEAGGTFEELRPAVLEYMQEKGYVLESENAPEGKLTFRSKNVARRISSMCEDRVTVTHTFGGLALEGLNRDIVRLKSGLEYKLKEND